MRIAVYDQFWATAGGGEKFAGGIAQVLSGDHDVSIVGHDDVDLDDLSERLQLDLSGVRYHPVPLEMGAVEQASEDYDLLVNASYTSVVANRASHGIYVVHFPQRLGSGGGLRGAVADRLRPLVSVHGVRVEYASGFHPQEQVGRRRVRWTDGDAEVRIRATAGTTVPVTVVLARIQPREVAPIEVTVEVDGEPVAQVELTRTESRLDPVTIPLSFEVRGAAEPLSLRIRSATFSPADATGSEDDRRLGVPLVGVFVGDRSRVWLGRTWPSLVQKSSPFDWLYTYDRVVSNSAYTQHFVRSWWGVDDGLLNPPVSLQPRGPKDPIILSVGRFFDAEGGHSKKQLEMVRAFRTMRDRGLRDWELHLVGGCGEADRVYLERVRHATRDLPVTLHVGASGAELRDLYSRAAIYWHATGLGEDPERDPDRFEHFGITTVEAMSAGAVPVVIGQAGQLEVLEDGVQGYHWQDLQTLVERTERLVADVAQREEFADAAQIRAESYGMDAFARRVNDMVEQTVATTGTTHVAR